VLEGMRKHPRQLSPVWFYDELGSFLFDSICELPEYYLTRTELQIMQQHAADMAHHIGRTRRSSSRQRHEHQDAPAAEPSRKAGCVRAGRHRTRSSARPRERDCSATTRRCA
jgi:hypothetical protein